MIDLQIVDVLVVVCYLVNKDVIVDVVCDVGVSNEVLLMFDGLFEQDYVDVDVVMCWVVGNFGFGFGI